jgi:anti-sigma regulatory factor (Ser/Thr protein kinase)
MTRSTRPGPLFQTDKQQFSGVPPSEEYSLQLDNRQAEIARASGWLSGLCSGHGLSKEDIFRLDLCLNEILQNIIQYSAATWIRVELIMDEIQAVLSVIDDGQEFDPTALPGPLPASSLKTSQAGGWGVHFLRKFSENITYNRLDQRNILEVTFRLKGDKAR